MAVVCDCIALCSASYPLFFLIFYLTPSFSLFYPLFPSTQISPSPPFSSSSIHYSCPLFLLALLTMTLSSLPVPIPQLLHPSYSSPTFCFPSHALLTSKIHSPLFISILISICSPLLSFSSYSSSWPVLALSVNCHGNCVNYVFPCGSIHHQCVSAVHTNCLIMTPTLIFFHVSGVKTRASSSMVLNWHIGCWHLSMFSLRQVNNALRALHYWAQLILCAL